MRHPNHSGDASHAYKIIYKECQFTLYHFKDSISLNAKVCAEGVISINITDKVCLIKDLLGKYNGYKVYYDACSMEACQAENTFNLIADVVSMLSLMPKERLAALLFFQLWFHTRCVLFGLLRFSKSIKTCSLGCIAIWWLVSFW